MHPLLQGFKPVDISVSMRKPDDPKQTLTFLQWAGTHTAWAQRCREIRIPNELGAHWAGVESESLTDFTQNGVSKDAFAAFDAATTSLHADRFQPGAPVAAVAGGAWVVPLVLANHPMAARLRTRTKLPPKNIDIAVTVSASVKWQTLTNSLARLAHAAWAYIEAGGAVRLTVHHISGFSKERHGAHGIIVSLQAPLTSKAGFATACSTQVKRAHVIELAIGCGEPRVPRAYWHKPGLFTIDGSARDAAVLEALRVR